MVRRFLTVMTMLSLTLGGRISFLQGQENDNYLHHYLTATILVADPEQTADLISNWVEDRGGYYLFKSSDRVLIRLPFTEIHALRQMLEEVADDLIEISPGAVDLRERLLGLESGIRSREEILQRNMSYIDRADVPGTLAIEQEIVRLLAEIEELKGKLRKLNTDRVYSYGDIHLSFMEETLPEDIPSSFDWINTVDFFNFMQGGSTR